LRDVVLSVDRLTVHRGNDRVVQDVSFLLEAATDTVIVGPNGAGKSTLIQAILGILPRQSGQVLFLGHPLSRHGKLPLQVRQQIAYLPQNCLFDRRIPVTVAEMVGLGWDDLGVQWPWTGAKKRRQAIDQALQQVDASHLRNHFLSELSGGECKRVLLAYCLVHPRRLLLLDEAPVGLDARGELDFYQCLDRLKREQGWAILQISHDLEMVRQTCDRVICLNQTIRCQGTPEVALSVTNLAATYGPAYLHYHHSCRGTYDNFR
jgi:zinc transport system ATP-binding protein